MPIHNVNKGTVLSLRVVCNFALVAFVAVGLGACSVGSMFSLPSGSSSLAPADLPTSIEPATSSGASEPATRMVVGPAKPVTVSMSSVIGAPQGVSKNLSRRLEKALKVRNVAMVKTGGTYVLRGYLAASPENKGTKLAYIWDVNDSAGSRQHRIIGEEFAAGGKNSDPWGGVDDGLLQQVTVGTADQLAGWIAEKTGGGVKLAVATERRAVKPNRVQRASRSSGPAVTASTGSSSSKRMILAMVVPVSGAPGDGKQSLTQALKKQLYDRGVKLTNERAESVYQVRGVVQVGSANNGKQPIRIDWRVYDPKGANVGTVTQRNELPKGAVDREWGKIADMAAGGAVDGITELLNKKAATSM